MQTSLGVSLAPNSHLLPRCLLWQNVIQSRASSIYTDSWPALKLQTFSFTAFPQFPGLMLPEDMII